MGALRTLRRRMNPPKKQVNIDPIRQTVIYRYLYNIFAPVDAKKERKNDEK